MGRNSGQSVSLQSGASEGPVAARSSAAAAAEAGCGALPDGVAQGRGAARVLGSAGWLVGGRSSAADASEAGCGALPVGVAEGRGAARALGSAGWPVGGRSTAAAASEAGSGALPDGVAEGRGAARALGSAGWPVGGRSSAATAAAFETPVARRAGLAILAVLAGLIAAALPSVARAGGDVFHIFTPLVEKGAWGIEALGTFQAGIGGGHDDAGHAAVRAGHEIAVHAGVTDSWMTKLALGLAREDGEDYAATTLAIENVIRIAPAAAGPVDFAWFTAVELGLESGAGNEVAFGPILALGHGPLTLVLNPFLEKSFGENREPGIAFTYAARLTYELSERLAAGVEAHGEIENIGDAPPLAEQTHRAGPVLYLGHLHGARKHAVVAGSGHDMHHGHAHAPTHAGGHPAAEARSPTGDWHAEVGVLFGLTHASPDAALKFNIGTHF